jgi:hypothetical protein
MRLQHSATAPAAYPTAGGNKLPPINGESFVTQNLKYVVWLAARHPGKYQYIVTFEMQPGTRNALVAAGARDAGVDYGSPELNSLPILKPGAPGQQDLVHIKLERDVINYGLRRGSQSIFNDRIMDAEGVGIQ